MFDPGAVVFDCDGVLFESHSANLAYYNRIFAEFNCPLISDPLSAEAHICHTASSPVVLAQLMKATDVKAALRFARDIDYREFIPLMTEPSDLKPALKRLSERFPLAVATNRGNSMQEVLEYFDLKQFFEVVVTSRDVENPKPAPDMLQLVARRIGVSPSDCLFIGDSELDKIAAAEGGMPFIAFGETIMVGHRVRTHSELANMILDQWDNKGFSVTF